MTIKTEPNSNCKTQKNKIIFNMVKFFSIFSFVLFSQSAKVVHGVPEKLKNEVCPFQQSMEELFIEEIPKVTTEPCFESEEPVAFLIDSDEIEIVLENGKWSIPPKRRRKQKKKIKKYWVCTMAGNERKEKLKVVRRFVQKGGYKGRCTIQPSPSPSFAPTLLPTLYPTTSPTQYPSENPSSIPTSAPTNNNPSNKPTPFSRWLR